MCRDYSGFGEEEACLQYAVPVMTSWPFRISNLVHLVFSTVGTLLLSWVVFIRVPYFPVHQNMKIISNFFVSNLLLNSVILVVATGHILLISFSFEYPCDAYLPPMAYRIINSLITFTSYAQTWLQLGFLIERSVATKMAAEYETWTWKLGGSLVTTAIFCTVVEYVYVFGFFEREIFEGREISYVFWPARSKIRFNHSLAVSISSSLIGLTICCFLYRYNKEELQKEVGCTLSERYQVSENVRVTEIVLWVSITTTITFIFSSLLVLSVRLSHDSIFEKNAWYLIAYSTARSACYPMPALSVLIPISCKIARSRQIAVTEYVKKREDTIEKYERILYEPWEKYP